ncbi:hypothetical protein LZ32DRAFT_230417 [Colletotrichum eremochloae]|nr:hypothetical protein LZ32DRAFT_230417 [Colletotrichum eremochloae]
MCEMSRFCVVAASRFCLTSSARAGRCPLPTTYLPTYLRSGSHYCPCSSPPPSTSSCASPFRRNRRGGAPNGWVLGAVLIVVSFRTSALCSGTSVPIRSLGCFCHAAGCSC